MHLKLQQLTRHKTERLLEDLLSELGNSLLVSICGSSDSDNGGVNNFNMDLQIKFDEKKSTSSFVSGLGGKNDEIHMSQ